MFQLYLQYIDVWDPVTTSGMVEINGALKFPFKNVLLVRFFVFETSLLHLLRLHLFDQKHSENSHTGNYYYNLNEL